MRKEYFFEELHCAAIKQCAAWMSRTQITSKLTLSSLEHFFLLHLEYHIVATDCSVSAFFSGLQLRGVLWFKAAANHFLFFEEWIFSQFGHSFLKVCFVCEPERLCALRVNPETGCRSVCKGAITVRHCSSASHTFERVPYAHAAHHDHHCIVHGSSPCNQRDGETE